MKFILSILIILTIVGVLEYNAIIPITQFSIIENLKIVGNFIKSLHIHSYYLILPDIKITVELILTVFLILFIVFWREGHLSPSPHTHHTLCCPFRLPSMARRWSRPEQCSWSASPSPSAIGPVMH